jgi:hypothetical protein
MFFVPRTASGVALLVWVIVKITAEYAYATVATFARRT